MSLSDFGQAGDVRLWLAAPKDLRSPLSGTEKGNPMQLDRIKNPYERVAVAEDKVIAALEKFPAATVLPSVLNYASELQACAVAAEEHLLKTNSPKKVFRVFEEEIWELSAACRRVPCDLHSDDAVIARMRDIVHQLDLDEQALVMKKVARQLFVRHRAFSKTELILSPQMQTVAEASTPSSASAKDGPGALYVTDRGTASLTGANSLTIRSSQITTKANQSGTDCITGAGSPR